VDIAATVLARRDGRPIIFCTGSRTLNRDPHAQWLASELRRAGVTNSISQWLDLLWFDPSIAAQGPAELPTLRHFDDMESSRPGLAGRATNPWLYSNAVRP